MNLKKPLAISMLLALLLGLSHKYLDAAPAAPSASKAATAVRVQAAFGRLPLLFEKNQGQFDPGVRFLSRGQHYVEVERSTVGGRGRFDDGHRKTTTFPPRSFRP